MSQKNLIELAKRKYDSLPSHGNPSVPDQVSLVVSFLQSRKIWFRLSRNQTSGGCKDAASKRRRSGLIGIPVHDELKSILCDYEVDGKRRVAIAHCRASQRVDFSKLKRLLKARRKPQLIRLSDFGLKDDVIFGLVNPWFSLQRPDIYRLLSPAANWVQVFDKDLLRKSESPRTVMTNAGDRGWGIELYSKQLFSAILDEKNVGDFGRVPT